MIREVRLAGGDSLKVPGVVPKLSATPGGFEGGGPALGQHTDEVLRELGYDDARDRRGCARRASSEHPFAPPRARATSVPARRCGPGQCLPSASARRASRWPQSLCGLCTRRSAT